MINRVAFLYLLLFSASFAQAAETPVPAAPDRWVTDTAGFLSSDAAEALNARLRAYEQSSKHQVIVYIGSTTGGVPIEDWAVRAFEAWKVGRKGIDDGLVLFIMAKDRRLRIEVGYGLEAQMPDATASRIINEIIVPRIRDGDRDGAVTAGVEAIISVLGGSGLPENATPGDEIGTGDLVIGGIVAFLFLILLITNPSLAVKLLVILASSGRHGGQGGGWSGGGRGGFGGGGWSGGGGRSGGGGASGSW